MISALLIAALLSADPSDAGIAQLTVESLYAKCPEAPPLVAVDGGYFTPEARQERENCKVAALEAFATPRLTTPDPGEPSPGIVLSLVGGGVVLAAVAFAAGFLAAPKK